MAMTSQYCDDRAADASDAAQSAKLDNVREREMRSADAWRAMGDRIRATDKARLQREQQRTTDVLDPAHPE